MTVKFRIYLKKFKLNREDEVLEHFMFYCEGEIAPFAAWIRFQDRGKRDKFQAKQNDGVENLSFNIYLKDHNASGRSASCSTPHDSWYLTDGESEKSVQTIKTNERQNNPFSYFFKGG